MMPQPMFQSPIHLKRQHGVSLFIVLIFVMLTMLLTLWASRSSLFNEMVVGNDADWQRAFEAGQTLLQDAELDIRGERADGGNCRNMAGSANVCRPNGVLQFPVAMGTGVDGTLSLFGALENLPAPARCKDGLCLKPERTQQPDFWNDKDYMDAMLAKGVRYGTYTGANAGSSAAPGNPVLAETGDKKGGWYWIEVMRTEKKDGNFSAGNGGLFRGLDGNFPKGLVSINNDPPLVYRITAVAKGRKEHTQVVLQEVFVQHRIKD